jgi:hypothetical protein
MWIGVSTSCILPILANPGSSYPLKCGLDFQKSPDTLSIARLRTSSENKVVANILYPTAIVALLNLKNPRSRRPAKVATIEVKNIETWLVVEHLAITPES